MFIRFLQFSVLTLLFLFSSCNSKTEYTDQPFADAIITVDSTQSEISLLLCDSIASLPKLKAQFFLEDKLLNEMNVTGNLIKWPMVIDTQRLAFNNFILLSNNKPLIELGIQLQSRRYLKNIYGFTSKNRYFVIERNTMRMKKTLNKYDTIVLMNEPLNEIDSIIRNYRHFCLSDSEFTDTTNIISVANSVTRFIWSFYKKVGPSDAINSSMTTWEMLSAIKLKGGTVQCASTRDMFISIFHILYPQLELRKVDAYRYWPQIDGIVVNSHALLGMKLNGVWILYDPFARVYLTHNNIIVPSDTVQKMLYTDRLNEIKLNAVKVKNHPYYNFGDSLKLYDNKEYNYFTHFYNLHFHYIVFK